MATLDTQPYRPKMIRYLVRYGLDDQLAGEEGFDPRSHAPLGKPGRRLLARIQRNLIARTSGKRRLYPKVTESGILDEPTRAALDKEFPNRPTFEDAFLQIAHQDDAYDKQQSYTQGPGRWQGVDAVFGKTKTLKAAPPLEEGDCSSGFTRWTLWALQQSSGRVPRDIVNGLSWDAGYTGTITGVCRKTSTPTIGTAIVYFNSQGRSVHVTGVTNLPQRLCVSHGKARAEIVGWDHHPGRYAFYQPVHSNA